jgi:cytochrome c oxidase subunit 2
MKLLALPFTLLAQTPRQTDDAGGGLWLPPQYSTVAPQVDWAFWFIFWLCVFFFVLIVVLMGLFMWKYRRRAKVQIAHDAPSHHTPLELTWTIIPLILVIWMFWMGLRGYVDLAQEPQNAYEVYVTAQQWSWTFEHRNGATEINQLTVPSGRPVKLIMTSTDVLHAFFVPVFRVKQDVVPGRYTNLWFESTRPGTYQLFCAEYCGTDHSQMAGIVRAMEADDFEREITELANWIKDVPDEKLHLAGLRVYARCASCHTLDGSVKIGPSFWETHDLWGQQRQLADGSKVVVDENYIRTSLMNPGGQIVVGEDGRGFPNQMPVLGLQMKEKEIRAMIEFIKRLDEVVDREGKPVPVAEEEDEA